MESATTGEAAAVAAVEAFVDAWNAKDWARWADLHTDDARHTGPDHAEPIVGRERILAAHQGLGTVFPDFRYRIDRIVAQGDRVCAEWTLTGTHEGAVPAPGGRMDATKRRVEVPGCFVFRVRDGRIAEYTGHVDFLGMYVQLGAIPPVSSDVGRIAS